MTYTFEGKVVGHRFHRQFSINQKDWKEIPTIPVSTIEVILTPEKDWPNTVTFDIEGQVPLGSLVKATIEVLA